MQNMHEIETLITLTLRERIEKRSQERRVETGLATLAARRRLRREIERMLEADGTAQSVLDVLDQVVRTPRTRVPARTSTTGCP
jgi:hypothetical protein